MGQSNKFADHFKSDTFNSIINNKSKFHLLKKLCIQLFAKTDTQIKKIEQFSESELKCTLGKSIANGKLFEALMVADMDTHMTFISFLEDLDRKASRHQFFETTGKILGKLYTPFKSIARFVKNHKTMFGTRQKK